MRSRKRRRGRSPGMGAVNAFARSLQRIGEWAMWATDTEGKITTSIAIAAARLTITAMIATAPRPPALPKFSLGVVPAIKP